MPDTMRIGLLGPLQVRNAAGHPVSVGGRRLRVLLIPLALEAGRIVPSDSLADQIWPEEPPVNPGNARGRWSPGSGPNCVGRAYRMTHPGPCRCQNAHTLLSARRPA